MATAAYEWTNPATLEPFAWPQKLLNAAVHSVMMRTAGFNSIDVGSMRIETLAITCAASWSGPAPTTSSIRRPPWASGLPHLVTGKMVDFIEFDDGFAIVKTGAPREAVGKALAESEIRGDQLTADLERLSWSRYPCKMDRPSGDW